MNALDNLCSHLEESASCTRLTNYTRSTPTIPSPCSTLLVNVVGEEQLVQVVTQENRTTAVS